MEEAGTEKEWVFIEYPTDEPGVTNEVGGVLAIASKDNAKHIVKCVNHHDELVAAARCALADLMGIMPEFEASGDRKHPAWKTIKELKTVLTKIGGAK